MSEEAIAELDRALSEMEDVRSSIEAADRTPFGDLGNLLDQMARDCDSAMSAIESAKKALAEAAQ